MVHNDPHRAIVDMLMTERHISAAYDAAILQGIGEDIRQAFKHIQDEEQEHARALVDALRQRGWSEVPPPYP